MYIDFFSFSVSFVSLFSWVFVARVAIGLPSWRQDRMVGERQALS